MQKRKVVILFSSYSRYVPYLLLTSLKVCDWSAHIFGVNDNPRSIAKNMAVTLFHFLWRCGGQYDNKYVAFELLMHAALAADEIGGFMPEPARIQVLKIKYRV